MQLFISPIRIADNIENNDISNPSPSILTSLLIFLVLDFFSFQNLLLELLAFLKYKKHNFKERGGLYWAESFLQDLF